MQIIYFDNAATTWPKPESVIQAVSAFLINSGGNPGRSGHSLSMLAGDIILECRQALADLFELKNPMRVVFTLNATMALNFAIRGLLKKGDQVIISSIEHNSVFRPIHDLFTKDHIQYSVWHVNTTNPDDLSMLENLIQPQTRMLIINHSSNVNGMILPIKKIGEICRRRNVIFVVDAAQSAGTLPISMQSDNIDLLAVAGHKGLYGPPGTGALLINDNFSHQSITPIITGGTGSHSSEPDQPDFLPDSLESGTSNSCGIAGLLAGLNYIKSIGLNEIAQHKQRLVDYFIKMSIQHLSDRVILHSLPDKPNTGVVAFNIKGSDPSEISILLSDNFGIMCRAGIHCAPLAHQTLNTFPEGSLRFSFSYNNTTQEIVYAIDSINNILKST